MKKTLLINIFTVIIVLAVVEVTSRIVLHKIHNRNFDSSLIVDNKYFCSSGLKANAEGKVWGKKFHTDEFGGRKNKLPFNSKKEETHLYIGDSVTEGVGLDDSSTFVSAISGEMPGINVLNISLIGYSFSDYVNVIQKEIESNPDITQVQLMFTLNDVYANTKTKDLPVMAKQNFAGKLNSLLQNKCGAYTLLKLLAYKNSDSYYRYDESFYTAGNQNFKQAMNCLSICDSLCREKEIPLLVFMLPYRSQLISGKRIPQESVRDYCQQHDIYFDDLADDLASVPDISSLYLFADEIHFSEKGHQRIAYYLLHHILYSHQN